jgi:hypothetical protein
MRITGIPAPLTVPDDAPRQVADAPHAYPCRRCLTDAEPGEVLRLVAYDPWTVDSPYRQHGPVFVHDAPCETAVVAELPEQQRRRLLSVRAFDAAGLPTTAEVLPGDEVTARLAELLEEPSTAFVHLHNAAPGCFAARVDR